MRVFLFLLLGGLVAPLLLAEEQTWSGYFNGGGVDVFTPWNEHYCVSQVDDTSVKFTLDTSDDVNACIYLTLGSVQESECDINPVLELDNVPGRLYKVIIAPVKSADDLEYNLTAEYDDGGRFGRCTDYYYAGYLGMSIDDINTVLAYGGMLTAIIFFGAITYLIMTMGNF